MVNERTRKKLERAAGQGWCAAARAPLLVVEETTMPMQRDDLGRAFVLDDAALPAVCDPYPRRPVSVRLRNGAIHEIRRWMPEWLREERRCCMSQNGWHEWGQVTVFGTIRHSRDIFHALRRA